MLSPTAAQKRLATAREKYRIYLSKHGSAVGSESHEDPTIATPQHAVVTPWRQGANEMEVASELAKLALQSPVVSTGYGDNDVTPLYDSGKASFRMHAKQLHLLLRASSRLLNRTTLDL